MHILHLVVVLAFAVGCRGVVRPHHAGCFRDEHGGNNMRQVAPSGIRYVTSDQNMTGPVCSYICFNKGFMFATVRRYQCKCTDVPANLPTEFQKCDVPCLGDPEQMCGGKPNLSTGYYTSASDEPPEGKDVACLEDTGDFRVIPEHRLELKLTNTPARCIGICLRLGYTYAGLRNSYECFCGTLRKQAPAAGGCDMPCPINKSSNCGGAGRIMVYRTTTEGGGIPAPTVDYLGCFKTESSITLQGYQQEMESMSTYECLAECYFRGFVLAGILEGRKCHCGSLEAIEAPRSAPDSRCSTACPGQPGSKCGGPGHYSVYTTGIVGDETAGKGLGCFNNTPDSFRTTEEFYLWTQNSPKDCIYECMKLGNAFAAVRKSVCKCGNWWPKNLNAEDSCSSRCPLSWYQSCGHEDFIGVYRTGLDSQIGSEPFVSTTAEQPSYKKIGDKMEKILFEDNFNSLDLDKWQKTVRISGEDNEFTVYSGDKENVFVKDGVLVIVPTVEEEDDFVARGSLDLRDCTGKRGTAQCRFQAMFSHVLPPTKSGQLCTKKSFKFKYGRVTIRAKLPIGDWILPQLWLKSSEEEYGEGYMSGKVVIASVAGNRNLTTQSGEDVGWKVLETGVVASSGPDHPSRSSVVFIKSDEPWQNDFHDFTVLWTPKRMVFYTDGDEKNAKTIYDTRIRSVVEYLGFNKSDDTWAGGSKSAPFDKEFHICLGVGVGGFQGFLDGVLSNGKQKPWSNFEVKSRLKFWRARDDWKPTWSDRSRLEVDSVIVTRE